MTSDENTQPGLTVDEAVTVNGPEVPSQLDDTPAEVPYETFRHDVEARLAKIEAKLNEFIARFG